MAENTNLSVADIIISEDLQPREGINREHAADIAEVYRRKGKPKIKRPRIILIQDEADTERHGKLFALDQHRIAAAIIAGRESIPVAKLVGTWIEARDLATSANTEHTALKRSREAKERAVQMCLEDHPDWTDGRIAKHTQVSVGMVNDWRPKVKKAAEVPPEKRTGLDGKKRRAPKQSKNSKPKPAADDPDRFQPILTANARISREINEAMNDEGGEKLLTYLTYKKLVIYGNRTMVDGEDVTPEPKFKGFPILNYIVRAAAEPGRVLTEEQLNARIEKWKAERESFVPTRS